jgi:uncharacterized protein YndB with AHSA1/START domain
VQRKFFRRGYDPAMGEFEFSATAKSTAAPEQVWAVVANPASWRSWWKQWEDAEADGPLAEGTVIRASRLAADVTDRDERPGEIGGAKVKTAEVRVLEAQEPSRLVLRNASLGDERFVFEISPAAEGSEIRYSRVAKVPRFFNLLGKMMKGQMENEARQAANGLAREAAAE